MADAGKTVLLVEDEAIIALNEAKQLKDYGYSVIHVSTGEKAIELVESDPGSIGIILMDIDLGRGMDGTEAARRILERFDIPVLFLSSHVERGIVAKTEGITNYGYVVKSSSFTVLDASIKMARKLFEAQRRIGAINMDFEAANEALRISLESLERSNAELAKSEEKFSKAFDLNPDSININRFSDGVYVSVNEGFTHLMGYSREEVIGRSSLPGNLGIWVREEDRKRLVQGLVEKGEVTDLEAEFRKKDGSTTIGWMSARTIEVDGEACILSITKDMGGWKRIERDLQETEQKFRMAFENAPVSMSLTALDGQLRMVNRAFCKLLGRSMLEMNSTDFMSLTHPEDRELSLEKVRQMIEGERANARFVKRYIHRNGGVVRADVSVTLVKDREGRPDYFITHILDITE
jgi:PAS domain S-box-containing protein